MSQDPQGPTSVPQHAFRLGLTVTELLYAIPDCYLYDDSEATLPPARLSAVSGELERIFAGLVESDPGLSAAVSSLREAASQVIADARVGWPSEHRRTWVTLRQALEEDGVLQESGEAVVAFSRAPMCQAWEACRATAESWSGGLTPTLGTLFDLGRSVGETFTQAELYRVPITDWDTWWHETLPLQVENLLRAARRHYPTLAAVPDLPFGPAAGGTPPHDGKTRAIRALADQVLAALAHAAPESAPAPTAGVILTAEPATRPVFSVPRLGEGESYEKLVEAKSQCDPEDEYIGLSLAVLRVFRQIKDLNQQPDLPVTLLGPSRSGKTRLAKIIHTASSRKAKKYLPLNPSQLNGGDDTIFREKWTGFGKNSGVGTRKAADCREGWLQKTQGGTIFVDELHSLETPAVEYLRALLGRDRTQFRPATGDGEAFVPEVRLLFATYKDIGGLKEQGVLPEDFVRRLLKRYVHVPSLNERREDIPLFVKSFKSDRKPDDRFLYALLLHDWSELEVDGLITAIKTAASRSNPKQVLSLDSLRGSLPDALIERVARLDDREVGSKLYGYLVKLLRAQGFAPNQRGQGLNVRLAELMGVEKTTIGRRLEVYGVDAAKDE